MALASRNCAAAEEVAVRACQEGVSAETDAENDKNRPNDAKIDAIRSKMMRFS